MGVYEGASPERGAFCAFEVIEKGRENLLFWYVICKGSPKYTLN